MTRLLKEPLLHFVLLAAALFLVSHFWSRAPAQGEADTIVVSEARIQSLILTFARTWQRPPTQDELDGLIEDFVKEEVFYREALAMGLDRDDTLIRRRMRQKLEFVAEDLADSVEPSEAQLQQYLDEHPDKFREQPRISFRQIYLNPDKHGDDLDSVASGLVKQLATEGESLDAAELGDSTLLEMEYDNMRKGEFVSLFGESFGNSLFDIEVGVWSGPIDSAYGTHIVLVQDRSEGRVPPLSEARSTVQREWHADRRNESKDLFFRSLRDKYKVMIDAGQPEQPVDGKDPDNQEASVDGKGAPESERPEGERPEGEESEGEQRDGEREPGRVEASS